MGSKKRQSTLVQESNAEMQIDTSAFDQETYNEEKDCENFDAPLANLKPMEKKKKRKEMDKERHKIDSEIKGPLVAKAAAQNATATQMSLPSFPTNGLPGFHIDAFSDLSSADSSSREDAAETLVMDLIEVQKAYESLGKKVEDGGNAQLEAKKNDGLEGCAPSLRYAIRRLIRGVSSSRECARQGFSLGLTVVVGMIPAIKLESLLKLIINLLEVPSAMKGQEARDCLLGRLFAYGSLARSQRLSAEWFSNKDTSVVKEFASSVISLANKKRYLREPAMAVILDMVEWLPAEALRNQVLIIPGMQEWFQKAVETSDPDVLFFALKLQERFSIDEELFGKVLPFPFNPESFFTRENLLYLEGCFKESTFCLPRVHSLWYALVNILVPDPLSQGNADMQFSEKHKKSQKRSSSEDVIKNVRCFCEVVIDEILIQSSHDRKLLALNILQLLLPRLPASCIGGVLSHKLVRCLMDILSAKSSRLHNAAQHFLKELLIWAEVEDDKRAAVIVSLQKHSNGGFDSITRTHTVRELVVQFRTAQGCLQFVHNLMSLFVDEAAVADEPSDQSQTTDENSEVGSAEDKGSPATSGDPEFLKSWVVDTMPRVLKNLKVDLGLYSFAQAEIGKLIEDRFKVQTEITKFLAVQGLFSASLGTEVTSFELQEKFKWPKVASSSSLCKMCIEQLQLLLEDAQKEGSNAAVHNVELNDLGSYFMCFLKTLCNIPSVSLYRTLNVEDKKAFNRLRSIECQLYQEERNTAPGLVANKLYAMRYLLIQLVLQILLYPDDFSEAALDIVICCKKAFPAAANGEFFEDEDALDDNDMPELMDVLIESLLSVLPRSSGRMCYVVEQVFRFFCCDITDYGLQRMLRVLKKDLKPLRHPVGSGDDEDADEDEDEDDVLGIEESEEMDEAKTHDDTNIGEGSEDDSEEMNDGEKLAGGSEDDSQEGVTAGSDVTDSSRRHGEESSHKFLGVDADEEEGSKGDASDDSDGGMDDDAMFRLDAYHAQLLKGRTGNDNALTQLISFKLRVLSLLEIYVQKHPGKSQVLAIYSCLVQAYTKYHAVSGNEQLGQRISGILQKKIFKAKDYPRGDEIPFANLEKLLGKSLKSASRSRVKEIASLAQASAFWLLKVIYSRNLSDSELRRMVQMFECLLVDYFNNKNCRLKSGFVKEVVRRHHGLGLKLLGFLVEKCADAKSEFRQVEALDMLDCIIKPMIPSSKFERDKEAVSRSSKLLKAHLPALCGLIQQLLTNLPGKPSRRAEVRRFCTRALLAVSALNLKKSFRRAMNPEAFSVLEAQLGNAALFPFKAQ
ncbi:DNA polymerase phi subunit [Apostasia shenzhenica]|uniref:DNA polymerase phi subunit n=1 Tax=Apostasia shenzhenica TaxID=1088818 RepID=A0A2I0AI52_9ASPA|nr:DNA polymerase phi subunit [Apostasia shenzhenica]